MYKSSSRRKSKPVNKRQAESTVDASGPAQMNLPASMHRAKEDLALKKKSVKRKKHSDTKSDQQEGGSEAEGEESEEEDEDDEEVARATSSIPLWIRPTKKQRITHLFESDTDTRMRCPHCLERNQTCFCEKCGLRRDQSFGSEQNLDIRAKRENKSTISISGHTSLGKRDQELERLSRVGSTFDAFVEGKNKALSPEEALQLSAESYKGTSFVPPSASLIRLIRSGKLSDVGYATPVTIDDQQKAARRGNVQALQSNENGEVRILDSVRPPPLTSMHQLCFTVLGVIIPSLIDNQPAIQAWCALMRTALTLEKERGWEVARQYVLQSLTHCIQRREMFGGYVRNVLDSVLSSSITSGTVEIDERAESPETPNSPSTTESTKKKGSCRQLNHGGKCFRGARCIYEHVCDSCGEDGHGIKNCPHFDKAEKKM